MLRLESPFGAHAVTYTMLPVIKEHFDSKNDEKVDTDFIGM